MSAEDRVVWLDVLTFLAIALVYLLVMYGLGFWLASFLMLSLVSLYLTKNKTRHNVALAIVTPLAACVVAYVVFEHVFYVPLPDATWWAGSSAEPSCRGAVAIIERGRFQQAACLPLSETT